MALSDEEKAQLEALKRKEQEPAENDFEVDIWDETGAGARVPYSKGKKWLERFGIDLPEQPADADQDQDQAPVKKPRGKPAGTPDNPAQRYFGKPKAVS